MISGKNRCATIHWQQVSFVIGNVISLGTFYWMRRSSVSNSIGEDPRTSHSFCEGVLISENYVLTTTICLRVSELRNVSATLWVKSNRDLCFHWFRCDFIFQIFVRLGKWNEAGTSVVDVPVAKYITHNQYNAFTGHNDIGLVKLQSNVVYTGNVFGRMKFQKYPIYRNAQFCLDSIRPICCRHSSVEKQMKFNTMNCFQVDGVKLGPVRETIQFKFNSISNWNVCAFAETCAKTKQKVKLNAVRKEKCEQDYKNYGIDQVINDGRICAGGQREYDTCAGKLTAINRLSIDPLNFVVISQDIPELHWWFLINQLSVGRWLELRRLDQLVKVGEHQAFTPESAST